MEVDCQGSSCLAKVAFCSLVFKQYFKRFFVQILAQSSNNVLPYLTLIFIFLSQASKIIVTIILLKLMQSYIRNDKNYNAQEDEEDENQDEVQKDRRIKRLTHINKELIETLKQQNEELTKKIEKQKMRGGGRITSHRSSPKNNKELQSIRKELSNAYKQIDMYKEVIQNLKAKEASLDHVDKVHEFQNKVKVQDNKIQQYQKEIKYLTGLREKQEKQLKVFENEDAKQSKIMLQKQITVMKQKTKALKKNAIKRSEIQKKQHSYFIELEQAMRKVNDDYYPGKIDPKKENKDDEQISQVQWTTVKSKLTELRRLYQENNKKLDMINRQKLRQLKSYQENQLKLKEKARKLNALKNRISQLTKLTVVRKGEEKQLKEPLPKKQIKNDKNRTGPPSTDRQVKKWNAPQTFHVEMGKVLPNSTFISDKSQLDPSHRYKIVEVYVYSNGNGVPCLISFGYESETGERVQGKQMIDAIPHNLELKVIQLQEKDFIWKISGMFKSGALCAITFKSKLGKEQFFEDQNFRNQGDPFEFYPKSGEIPSCFYGATVQASQTETRICYLGFEFTTE